jgi:hypothetical protein
MKRMNLIHGVLVAVLTFMGTVSLSAQNWLPAAQAANVIASELNVLEGQPAPQPAAGFTTKQQVYGAKAAAGCPSCVLNHAKILYLKLVMVKLKNGTDTGTAVNEVRTQMLNNANNNAQLIQTVQNAYEFVLGLLS